MSPRSGNLTYLLALLGGTLGLHHFYTGNYRAGALMLLADTALTLFGVFLGPVYLAIGIPLALWWLTDLARISSNKYTDGNNRTVSFLNDYGNWPKLSLFITGLALLTAASSLMASMSLAPALIGGAFLVAGIVCIATVLSRLGGNNGSSTYYVPTTPVAYSSGSTVTLVPTLGRRPAPIFVAEPITPFVSRPHHVTPIGLGHTFGHGSHGGSHVAVNSTSTNHHGGHARATMVRAH